MDTLINIAKVLLFIAFVGGLIFLIFKLGKYLLSGALNLFDEASDYGFIGKILFFASWIFLTPLMVIWCLFRGWDLRRERGLTNPKFRSYLKLSFEQAKTLPLNDSNNSEGLLPGGESFQLPGTSWRLFIPESDLVAEIGTEAGPILRNAIKHASYYYLFSDNAKESGFLQITKNPHGSATFEKVDIQQMHADIKVTMEMFETEEPGHVIVNYCYYTQHPVWGESLPPILKYDASKGLLRQSSRQIFTDNGYTYTLSFDCHRDQDLAFFIAALDELLHTFKLSQWNTQKPFYELHDPCW